MPRRSILSASERDTLLALPDSQDDLIRYYTFNESDLSLIRQRRGDANRLGFAVQLCLLRYPGYLWVRPRHQDSATALPSVSGSSRVLC
ncbi:TnpA transposase [Pseudomonas syringae pv. papulans]|nr:TnpA transposase [Pseudomonas syringae pv. papulans]RMN40235.1 TnpA transposase [Pseudomonas syringae pv. papulans]RMN78761.1 TnpA transposase [Pseudomonas syringae pv. papulans]